MTLSVVPEWKYTQGAVQLYPLSLSMPMATLRFTSPRVLRTVCSTATASVTPAIIVTGSAVNKKIRAIDVVAMDNSQTLPYTLSISLYI